MDGEIYELELGEQSNLWRAHVWVDEEIRIVKKKKKKERIKAILLFNLNGRKETTATATCWFGFGGRDK